MSTHAFEPDDNRLYCDRADCGLPRLHPVHGERPAAQQAHARNSDPATSHAAAERVRDLNATQRLVLRVLADIGPSTDERLAAYWREHEITSISPSGLRTRRSELVDTGHVVDTGQLQLTDAGHSSIVWAVADEA